MFPDLHKWCEGAAMVEEVLFVRAEQVAEVVAVLRAEAVAAAVFSSCLRPRASKRMRAALRAAFVDVNSL